MEAIPRHTLAAFVAGPSSTPFRRPPGRPRTRPPRSPTRSRRGWAVESVTRALRKVDAGEEPDLLLRLLERMGIGFSS
jgi:hypothetical protein